MLGQTGVTASHLGFGCSYLPAERGNAIRILEHAFSQGITHFDVARIYGFGRAEDILGEFLRTKRNQVTVATKFGIQPPSGISANRGLVEFAKKILGPFPGIVRRVRRRRSQMVQTGVFTPQSAVQSLELSLRTMGVEAVDIFFLHEATLVDAASAPLIETLRQQVSRGTIRSFGVASRFKNLDGDADRLPSDYQVVQFEHNAAEPNLPALVHREKRAIITHSVFQPLKFLRETIAARPDLAQKYTALMNLNLAKPNVLGSLLLQYSLRSNSDGVVLFSSMNAQRISANASEADSCPYSEQQLSTFVEFAKEALQTSAGMQFQAVAKNPWDKPSQG